MSASTSAPRVISSALSASGPLFSLCRNTHVSTSRSSPWSRDLAPCSTWLAAPSGPSWRDGCFRSCLICTCQVPCTVFCCLASRTFFTKGCGSSPMVPFIADAPSLPVWSVPSQLPPSPCAPPARPPEPPVPNLAVSLSQPVFCFTSCTYFGAFSLPILIMTNSRLSKKSKIWGLVHFVGQGANILH